ncbi:MAG: cation transporter, partial [Flavobacteriales bacterium]
MVRKAGLFGFITNLLLAVLKAIAGVVGNSAALLADAIESTADVISSFLLFIG